MLDLSTMYDGIPFSPVTILVQGINAADTALHVENTAGFPPGPNFATLGTDANAETVLYAQVGDGVLSGCTRGIEGTPKTWEAGEPVARNFTNADYARLTANIKAIGDEVTTHEEAAGLHVTQEKQAYWDNGIVYMLSCTKSDSTFALTGAPSGVAQFTAKFNAPAEYAENDTFTLGGTAYTAKLMNGETLPGKLFAAGAKGVSVEVDTTGKTLGFKSGGSGVKLPPQVEEVWNFSEYIGGSVKSFAMDVSGNSYIGCQDKTVRKINGTGEEIFRFSLYPDSVGSIAVDATGNLYVVRAGKSVCKIDTDGEELWRFTGHEDDVLCVAVDQSGNVYSGGFDKTVRKISAAGSEIWRFTGHTNWIHSIAVDEFGYVYSGGGRYDETVRKIDSTGTEVWCFIMHYFPVTSIAIDASGNVYSGSISRVYKTDSTGAMVWSFDVSVMFATIQVAVDKFGNLYIGSDRVSIRKVSDSGVLVWDFNINQFMANGIAVDAFGNIYGTNRNESPALYKLAQNEGALYLADPVRKDEPLKVYEIEWNTDGEKSALIRYR